MSIETILQAWDRFWFSEVSPLSVAVYRIFLGFLCAAFVLLLIPDLFVWFGSQGMCSFQAVAD
ncbi:deoxyribonuclease HsdR, partial [bacterium]|nr:deoxyribonuclease HsdR [bacterium]